MGLLVKLIFCVSDLPIRKCDEFGGKFYSLYPLGWLKLPTFEFKTNYEPGLCFPTSCTKEHVLLLMTSMKPSEFEELSLETIYSSRNGLKTSSAQVTGIVGQKKQLTSQTVYLTAVLEYMPPEIKRNNAAYLGFISVRIRQTSGNCIL